MDQKINHINFESDFIVPYRFSEGARPTHPWRLVFATRTHIMGASITRYIAGFDGERYVNCTTEECREDGVLILFDNHHLPPGRLCYNLQQKIPNLLFGDGTQERYDPYETGVELWEGPSDDSPLPEELIPVVQAALRGYSAYEVAVKDGYQGTEAEWLDSLKGGPKGDAGVSPEVSVVEQDEEVRLRIVDAKGEKETPNLKGKPGDAGVSPEVSVVEQDEEVRLRIVDAQGEKQTPNLKGGKGDTGLPGAPGRDGIARIVVQGSEQIVGDWIDEKYGERLELWERIVEIDAAGLTGEAGSLVTVELVGDLRLEPGSWLRAVDAALVRSNGGGVEPLPGAVARLYQEGTALKAEIRKPEQAAGTLAVQVRYVKYHGEELTFELKVPEAVDETKIAGAFPALKYFKKVCFVPVYDDSNVTAYCNVWAFINHRKRYDTEARKYFHKGAPKTASDTYTLYPSPLDFDNGTGRRIRYSFGCALWPNWGNEMSPNGFIGETTTSLYSPYICWDELRRNHGVRLSSASCGRCDVTSAGFAVVL